MIQACLREISNILHTCYQILLMFHCLIFAKMPVLCCCYMYTCNKEIYTFSYYVEVFEPVTCYAVAMCCLYATASVWRRRLCTLPVTST